MVVPVEGDLQDRVHEVQRHRAGNLEPPPDRRLRAVQAHLDPAEVGVARPAATRSLPRPRCPASRARRHYRAPGQGEPVRREAAGLAALEIPSAMPLNLVHAVLQIAFDWPRPSPARLRDGVGQFGSPTTMTLAERQDEATATLAQVAGPSGKWCTATTSATTGATTSSWRRSSRPSPEWPTGCTGGRRDGPPEDCGGIWVFNEQFADLVTLFNVGDLNERLADLATS